MGFAVLIDVLGSIIVGGILLLTLFRMNNNATQNTYNFTGELILQQNLVTTVETLEYEFRKIGYCENPINFPFPEQNSILFADTSNVKFLTDLMISPYYDQGNGVMDTIQYYLGPASELTETPNPYDRMLYRVVNGQKTGVNLGITYFKVRYFRDSSTGTGSTTLAEILPKDLPKVYVTGSPTGITAMQIDIRVENTATYDAKEGEDDIDYNPYRHAFWRQVRLSSRNLKR